MMLNAVIFVLTVFFSGSHQQCFSPNDNAAIWNNIKYITWTDSRNDFSLSMLQTLNDENSKENVIFSPSSIHDALLLAYFGAAHATESSLAKFLLKSYKIHKSEAWDFYRTERIMHSAQERSSYPLKFGNKIFFSNLLKLRPCIQEKLRAETELLDYRTNVQRAKNYINNWASNMTEGEIKDVVEDLSPTSPAILVNAVFFKAKWLDRFNPNATQKLPFRVNSKTNKTTSMMVKTGFFPVAYLDDIKVRLLKLAYARGNQAMIILLPDNDLDSTLKSLCINVIKRITRSNLLKKSSGVEVMIPKYKKSNDIDLISVLGKLGIGNALSGSSDFSRFTGTKDVFFTNVYHKAKIEVDEEGTKAAAVTVLGNKSALETFICDRPFAYFIYDYIFEKILFMGTFRHPVEEE